MVHPSLLPIWPTTTDTDPLPLPWSTRHRLCGCGAPRLHHPHHRCVATMNRHVTPYNAFLPPLASFRTAKERPIRLLTARFTCIYSLVDLEVLFPVVVTPQIDCDASHFACRTHSLMLTILLTAPFFVHHILPLHFSVRACTALNCDNRKPVEATVKRYTSTLRTLLPVIFYLHVSFRLPSRFSLRSQRIHIG